MPQFDAYPTIQSIPELGGTGAATPGGGTMAGPEAQQNPIINAMKTVTAVVMKNNNPQQKKSLAELMQSMISQPIAPGQPGQPAQPGQPPSPAAPAGQAPQMQGAQQPQGGMPQMPQMPMPKPIGARSKGISPMGQPMNQKNQPKQPVIF